MNPSLLAAFEATAESLERRIENLSDELLAEEFRARLEAIRVRVARVELAEATIQ